MTKRKRWQTTEKLDKPIRIPYWPGSENDPIWRDELKQRRHEKASAYFKHFNIDPVSPDRWEQLAYALGEGFRDEHKLPRGRSREFSRLDLLGLQAYIDRELEGGVKNEKTALRKLLTDWYRRNRKELPSKKTLNAEAEHLQKVLSRARRLHAEGKVGLGPFFSKESQ